MTGLFDPGSDPSTLATSREAGMALLSHLRLVVRQKAYGCGSALDLLNQARLSGRLSIREMLASSIMLAHASYQNSMNLLCFASLETVSNPDVHGAITDGTPAEQRSCVEELLRLASPARFLIRRASADLTIGSTPIGKGEIVILAIGMANRDPDVFPDPDHFDGSRKRISHLAFGSGAHACLGAAHARATTLAALRALAGRYRAVTVESITWGSNLVMYGPVGLEVGLRG
jgi:cytochrome P450